MLKTLSAALLAVSVLAAPALAKSSGKTAQAPVIKAEQAKQVTPAALNANARMGYHHRQFRHHRFHKHVGALKTNKLSKVTIKHATPVYKHG